MEVFRLVLNKSFSTLRIECPAALEDELVGRLYALGGAGSWSEPAGDSGRVRVHSFFADGSLPSAEELSALGAGDGDGEVRVGGFEPVAERDWAAEWRAGARPIEVGERFLVDPREPADVVGPVDAGGRFLLRLPARTAFGLGSHESTRLAVELLEASDVAGKRVLDVGTGSGILAFASLLLGARSVVAFDLDPAAALLLREYQELNDLRFPGFVGTMAALECGVGEETRLFVQDKTKTKTKTQAKTSIEGKDGKAGRGSFDLALVNVVPSEIVADLPALVRLLRPGGSALFSGVLAVELSRAVGAVEAVGLRERVPLRRVAGEWAAFVAEVPA